MGEPPESESGSERPSSGQELLYSYTEGLEQCSKPLHWLKHRESYFESHGVTEDEFYQDVLEALEEIVGPIYGWQRFYIIAAISGRGVEWAQTRGRPHYHIVGLPCAVCGRS